MKTLCYIMMCRQNRARSKNIRSLAICYVQEEEHVMCKRTVVTKADVGGQLAMGDQINQIANVNRGICQHCHCF